MKASWRDLAIMGGAPEFAEPVIVGRPNTGDTGRFLARMETIFAGGQFSNNGPFVQEFEGRVAAVAGARHCIATCNATIALELAVAALGLTGSVVVPSFTFIATAHALARCGVAPLFCDVDPATHTITRATVEEVIRPDTSGIMGVHLWGRACPVEELEGLAAAHGLRLLFDAAHAFGCTHGGRPIGTFGALEVFSFHATKAINSFEGGAIVTNDDRLAAKLREMIVFGQNSDGIVARLGTNAKMSEPCAAMGVTSIEAMDTIFERNRANGEAYRSGLSNIPGVRWLGSAADEVSNGQFAVIEVDPPVFGMTRENLIQILAAENVVARGYFDPACHRSEPYRSRSDGSTPVLPTTDRLSASVLSLPTGLAISPDQVARICGIVALSAQLPRELSSHLPTAPDAAHRLNGERLS
jgi:dTDP-4-amino-4,6-dideoxygalactose transaminase